MNRPMPGPPGGFTDYARLNWALLGKQITYGQYQEFGAELTRAFTGRRKHLTDAECAAEYWRAMHNVLRYEDGDPGQNVAIRRADTWHRFAAHPHYNEETP